MEDERENIKNWTLNNRNIQYKTATRTTLKNFFLKNDKLKQQKSTSYLNNKAVVTRAETSAKATPTPS